MLHLNFIDRTENKVERTLHKQEVQVKKNIRIEIT